MDESVEPVADRARLLNRVADDDEGGGQGLEIIIGANLTIR